MVAILEKSEHNVDFHPIVDFVEASPLKIETTEEGTKILATVDGILRTVTESSLRRNLKLQDKEGTIDEHASPLRDVSEGEAYDTASGFKADQVRANIAKTSTLPHDLAPRVTSPAANEDSMQLKLDELIERSRDNAPIKGRNLDEGEAVVERVSNDTEEKATLLTSMDVATVLASRVAEVTTGSRSIPTIGPPAAEVPTGSDVVPTAGLIFATTIVVTSYTRRKGKEIMVESETPKKKKIQEQIDIQMARQLEEKMERDAHRMNKQIARDAEIARIHAEEELQIMIDGLDRSNETTQQRKPWSKKQKRDYYMAVIKSNLGWKVKDFREMTFEEIKAKFTTESVKKLKTSESVPKEVKLPDEVLEEKVHTMGQRSYWKITRLGGCSASYQFFVNMLKHLNRKDLNQLWALVKESLSNRQPTSDKEMELWLYDTSAVHHVTAKDKEILILMEKDYPFRKGLAIGMISYKLQVENYSKMANDLILKIYKIASNPRQQVIEFPLPEAVPTASEENCHCKKKREATAVKIALLLKSRRNCQSKSDDSYTNSSIEESMNSSWFSKGQELEIVRVLWSTYYHIQLYIDDLTSREKISTFKVYFGLTDQHSLELMLLRTSKKYTKNLKVYEMIIKKDFEIVKAKVERKSLALKAKKESSDEVRLLKVKTNNTPWRECPKPLKDKNQRAFVEGSWNDSGEEDDEKVKNETCLVV
nr:hypothetical protein [Tanacetum cinerariifolium]